MPFLSLRFGQFCDFHPNICFPGPASRSRRFEILQSSDSLTSFIFLGQFRGISVFF
ncbi:hypothetical protein Hanom_Chr02g00096461 [Helianthus anomalus]